MKKSTSRVLALSLAVLMTSSLTTKALAAPVEPIDRETQPSLMEIYKDDFLLGNIYAGTSDFSAGTERSNLMTKNYNVLTGENCMKPNQISSGNNPNTAPTFNWTAADAMMNSAEQNDMKVHGHVLLWHGQSPVWVNGGAGTTPGTVTRAKAKENMELHIKTVVEHFDQKYPGTIISWDVVNEAFLDGIATISEGDYWRDFLRPASQSGWIRAYSNGMDADAGEKPSDFIYDGFVLARKYTDATLYYNDFNLYQDGKSKLVAQMVNELNEQYKAEYPDDPRMLIEVVGMQAHNYIQDTPASSVENGIKNLLATGVNLAMSELDLFCFYPWNAEPQGTNGTYIDLKARTTPAQLVGSNGTSEEKNYWASLGVSSGAEVEKIQAERYAEYFQVYKKYADNIDRVTFWGLRDSDSWRRNHNPLLFNADYTPKEAFWAVADPDGYLGKTNIASALKLTADKSFVSKGEYFNVAAALDPSESSNTASLTYTFDADKYQYRGFTPADGITVISTNNAESGNVTFILGNLVNYDLTGLGTVLFSAREDVNLKNENSTIKASLDYVTLYEGEKSILKTSASLAVGTIGIDGDTDGDGAVTLIDLSNMIDWFGVKADGELWSKAQYFDFNNNGEIDINDIAKVASLITGMIL